MDASYGIGLGLLGCIITITGFFIAFLVIKYNHKKQKQKEEAKKNRPHGYWGDDTV